MKKIILNALVVTSVVLASSAAFAGTLSPGTIYSLGSSSPTAFKTSPKVTLLTNLTAGTSATAWAAITYHTSAISKTKGVAYYSNSTDPGLYDYVNFGATAPTAPTDATTVPTNFIAEK